MQIHGLDEADAVDIAVAIDMHDKQTTDRRFRKKIAARLMELLDNPDYAETLKQARTIRKLCIYRGIYTHAETLKQARTIPRSKSKGRANPVDFRTNRQISHMPWRTTT